MVVDDVADNVTIVVRGLLDEGVVPLAFTDPRMALDAALADPPDAFVLDLAMPGIDGVELARRLRATTAHATTPVLFLTASDDPSDLARAYAAGGNDYVVKPVRLPELVARLSVHVEREAQRLQLVHDKQLLEQAASFRETVEAVSRHDLRAPLTVVLGTIAILRERDLPAELQQQLVDRAHAAAVRMLTQLERTLDLHRIEQGLYDRPPAPVGVDALLDDVVLGMGPMVEARDVALELAVDTPRPVVGRGDEDLLYSALSNLLRNAVEAAAGERGRVEVRLSSDEDRITVRITNDGEVPAAVRDRFFEKFVTSGKADGTGLGTYSARRMMRASGGEVELLPPTAGRTAVEVTVPREG